MKYLSNAYQTKNLMAIKWVMKINNWSQKDLQQLF